MIKITCDICGGDGPIVNRAGTLTDGSEFSIFVSVSGHVCLKCFNAAKAQLVADYEKTIERDSYGKITEGCAAIRAAKGGEV